MKRQAWFVALWLVASAVAVGAPQFLQPKKFLVVRVTGFDKSAEYQVMTPDEFQELQLEVRRESVLLRRALDNAKNEWDKNELMKGEYFPRTAIVPRQAEQRGTPYMDEEKARDKVASILQSEKNSEERKAKREAEIQRQRYQYSGRRDRSPVGARELERKREKEKILQQAIELVRTELDKLKSTTPGASKHGSGGPVPAVDMQIAPGGN